MANGKSNSSPGRVKRGRRISTKRLKKDPAFQNFRDNGKDMGTAAKASKTLRLAFRLQIKDVADKQVTERVNQIMRKIIGTDLKNPRGQRTVTHGNIDMLKGFEFNLKGRLSTMLFAPYDVKFDRASGKIEMIFPSVIPDNVIAAPSAATHFRLIVAVSEIDFANHDHNSKSLDSPILRLTSMPIEELNFHFALTPGSLHPVVAVVGIEFYQQTGDELMLFPGAANRAVAVGRVFPAGRIVLRSAN